MRILLWQQCLFLFLLISPLMIIWDWTGYRVYLWWFWRKSREEKFCSPPPSGYVRKMIGPKSWPWKLYVK